MRLVVVEVQVQRSGTIGPDFGHGRKRIANAGKGEAFSDLLDGLSIQSHTKEGCLCCQARRLEVDYLKVTT